MKLTGLMLVACLILSFEVPAAAGDGETDFFGEALAAVHLGKGVWTEQLLLFPLLVEETPDPLDIVPDREADELMLAEPEWPEKRYNLGAANAGDEPILLLGGSLLRGGRLDRLIPVSVILPPKAKVEIETLLAEYPKDRRRESVRFSFGPAVAPSYLRERAVFDPSRYLVPIFISHFLEFRNEGDKRHSMAALDDSKLLAKFCLPCQQAAAKFPDVDGSKVVGYITAVRGRLSTLEIFATNDLLRAYFPHILHGHTYEAAAIALKAKDLGMSLPGRDEREKTLTIARKAAEDLLESLKSVRIRKSHVPEKTVGNRLLLRTGQSQGTALGLDGRLVHAIVYPHNPFEEALFSAPFERADAESAIEASFGDLGRREERGNLTEEERRLLERMRERRRR